MTDVAWVGYPKSYTRGRARAIQFIVLHYTAGSEGPTAAENGVRYDKVRTDGTSTHYFTDSYGPALQEVPDGDRAHAARYHGNEIGIQIEICGTIQTRSQWLDPVSLATLKTTAGVVTMLLRRHNLAFQRLATAQVRAAYYNPPGQRPTGICEHADCTVGFPEDGGSHMDVGPGFPWDVFMDLVRDELEGDDMELGGSTDGELQKAQVNNAEHYLQALTTMSATATGISNTAQTNLVVANALALAIKNIQAKLADPQPVEVDADAVAAALVANADFRAFLVEAARQGAEQAEDS